MRWVTQAQSPADKQAADDRSTDTTGTADIWAAFGLKAPTPEEIHIASSSEEEREKLSPQHAAIKRRLDSGNDPPSQPASSSSLFACRAKPAPLTKAFECKRTGKMRRLDHKGHIETYDPQKGWPSEQDLDPGEQLSPDSSASGEEESIQDIPACSVGGCRHVIVELRFI
jgi:hypothetical protein